jgi:hypothetical protein
MRFHTVDEDDAIRPERFDAAHHWDAIRGDPDLTHLEGGPDGRVHRLLGDSIGGENLCLALRCRPAVTAHGGNDERLRSGGAQLVEDAGNDLRQLRNAAASHGHGDAGAGHETPAYLFEFRIERVAQVQRRQDWEVLPDAKYVWEWLAH